MFSSPALSEAGRFTAGMAPAALQGLDKASGGTRPHKEYQDDPIGWAVDMLGVEWGSLVWSQEPGMEDHEWDGTVDPLGEVLLGLARGQNVGVESGTGTGKAQPIDTPVLTVDGWVPIGRLLPGDSVVGRDGKPTEVLAVYPQGNRPVYRLTFSDGASTRACAEHIWVMQSKKDLNLGCPWRLMTTADLLAMDGHTLHNRSLRVPLPGALDLPDADLPIPPYLLGVLLGDGCFRANSPSISTADNEVLGFVVSDLPDGVSLRHSSAYDYRITGERGTGPNPLTESLKMLGLWGKRSEDKHIPHVYLWASTEQRLALLRGLLDTDGSVSGCEKSKHIEFCSASFALAGGVVDLVRSLGGTAKLRQQSTALNGECKLDRYRVAVNLPEGVVPFRLSRKADVVRGWGERSCGLPSRILRTVESAGDAECVCIRVAAADSLYVTEDFIVTHNTYLAAIIVFWFLACFEDAIVVTAAPKEAQLKLHVWKEIGRLWPRFKRHFPDAQILDGKIRMRSAVEERETWAATAFVCGVGADEASATKAQGFHAEHMLIITEETPGIHPAIMVAFENTCTAPHNLRLALGNPDHVEDELHQFCLSPGVTHIRVSALDHPNVALNNPDVVPGAVSRSAVERRKELYAHTPALYESRIRGISPKQAHGVALHAYDDSRNMVTLDDDLIRERIKSDYYRLFGGMDFGAWRFGFLLLGTDPNGVTHELLRYFSQRETLTDRARAIHDMLEELGIEKRFPIEADAANPQDILEINVAFRRDTSPFRVRAVAMESKARAAAVERLNELLFHTKLLFRKGESLDHEWRLGMGSASDGRPMNESRLLWEVRTWRYPDARTDKAQKQDPDDNTADGADMIAALRYAIMTHLRPAKPKEPEEPENKNFDTGLETYIKRRTKSEKAAKRGLVVHRSPYGKYR